MISINHFIKNFVSGLAENLAEAIGKSFYESYETWKHDEGRPSTDVKVHI